MVVVSFSYLALISVVFSGLSFVVSVPVVDKAATQGAVNETDATLSAPAAPHFVIYSDQGTGSAGPPAASAVKV
jgi:hypothetical protein